MFERFNNSVAEIIKLGDYDDYEGTYTKNTLGLIEGDLQPYSGILAEQDYGLKVECEYQFFCAANENVTDGNYLVIGSKAYKIIYTSDFGKGLEVLLKGAVLK